MAGQYTKDVEKILSDMEKYKDYCIPDIYYDLERKLSDMENDIEDSLKEGRLLRIGIVGEVKAGKSSFLNALLFDGEDILPKSSIPMTAALTKIAYSERPFAKIVFFGDKDWEKIQEYARSYDKKLEQEYKKWIEKQQEKPKRLRRTHASGPIKTKEEMRRILEEKIPERYKACKELVCMEEKTGLNRCEYLGKEITIEVLNEKVLEDYIGAEGRYTPIVKYVELYKNESQLEGVEIIDTPGLNDPVISRGVATKDFLKKCDVVFLLSYCGQFLNQKDISFMCNTLPGEGIKEIVLVGSKFDSGMLEHPTAKDWRTACNLSKKVYDNMAVNNIEQCMEKGNNKEILGKLKDSLPPAYISSMLFSCAVKRKMEKPYSPQEQHVIDNMKKHFPDFEDDYKLLLGLSGIKQQKKKLDEIREKKQEIIQEKNRTIFADYKKMILGLLEDINIQACRDEENLRLNDRMGLEKKLETMKKQLNKSRRNVRNIFESAVVESESLLNKIAVDLEDEIENYIEFDVKESTIKKERSRNVGFLGLWTESYIETRTVYSASVADVIENLRKYVVRCKQYTNNELEKLINIHVFKEKIKKEVIQAFESGEVEFNEDDILIPVENVIKRMRIPQIQIDIDSFQRMIIDSFSGEIVEGEEIHQLRIKENQVLQQIVEMIKAELDKTQRNIDNLMSEQSATFLDCVIEQMDGNIKKLEKQLLNKEENLRQYGLLIETTGRCKKMVIDWGSDNGYIR